MEKRYIIFFIFTGIILICPSCEHHFDPSPEVVPDSSNHGLIPAALGNSWLYRNSFISPTNPELNWPYSEDTTVIISVWKIYDKLWWRVRGTSDATEYLSKDFRNKDGAVLAPSTGRDGYNYATQVFIAPTEQETEYRMFFKTDTAVVYKARLIKETLRTAVGVFSSYALYWRTGVDNDSIFIVPNIGIVLRIRHNVLYYGSGPFTITSSLLYYRLAD
jgi:hypothetical protein